MREDPPHPLDDLLSTLSVRAHIAFRGLARGRCGIGGSAPGRLGFHLVLDGRCLACVPDLREPIELAAGALFIYRPSCRHLLAESADTGAITDPQRIAALGHREAEPHVGLLCGYFDCGSARSPLIDALPPYLLWRDPDAMSGPLARLAQTVRECALDVSRAGERILTRLCELLLHLVLREPAVVPLELVPDLRTRCDPALRRALEGLHARPGKHWTLAALAHSAGMSRSTFAERFREATGTPAMTYLRQHRLALAEQRMRDEGLSIAAAAQAMGFGSAAALRRVRRRAALRGARHDARRT